MSSIRALIGGLPSICGPLQMHVTGQRVVCVCSVVVRWWSKLILVFTSVHIDSHISSDASGSGYFVVNLDRLIMLKTNAFSQFESLQSSTY